ncbi:unnamed protein product [Sphenostylis stenocarpa]|uniref:Uncharacterized protein n=1 Tax=Sphenostylis stenocarpa TaxID=92480 RepID=A0AA86VCF6_9FABA|nr:unnamed protein product [Sphenostylis stenocarpa]
MVNLRFGAGLCGVRCPMFILSQKLKALKIALRPWNREVFVDVHHRVENLRSGVVQYNCNWTDLVTQSLHIQE